MARRSAIRSSSASPANTSTASQAIAHQVADKVRAQPARHATSTSTGTSRARWCGCAIDQDRARALGVSSAQLAQFLSGSLSGLHVSTYREGNELIEVLLRGADDERARLDLLAEPRGAHAATASRCRWRRSPRLEYAFEDGIIWHRDRLPTVTVRADIANGRARRATVVAQIAPTLDAIRAHAARWLPPGNRRHGRGFRARPGLDQRRACRCSCWWW